MMRLREIVSSDRFLWTTASKSLLLPGEGMDPHDGKGQSVRYIAKATGITIRVSRHKLLRQAMILASVLIEINFI